MMNLKELEMKCILYKTTNIVNNKIYIGIHVQKTPEFFDGYLGSGTLLKLAVEKHGAHNFIRETLFIFDTIAEAKKREKQIVSEEFVKCPSNYNISIGGTGGNTTSGFSEEQKAKYSENLKSASIISKEKRVELYGGYFSKEVTTKMSVTAKKRILANPHTLPDNKGRLHSAQSKDNFTRAAKEWHSKFMYITDGNNTVKHDRSLPIPSGWKNGHGSDRPRLQHHTEKAKCKIGNSENIKGIKKYTDGVHNINVKKDDIIPNGYYPGITGNGLSRVWITDGTSSKKMLKTDVLPAGFKLGRVFKGKVNE